MLTAERVRELLAYDPETGWLTWRVRVSNRAPGSRVGCKGGGSSGEYRVCHLDRRMYYEHRLIWLWVHGEWPTYEVDHINQVKDDNRLVNLREATRAQNSANHPCAIAGRAYRTKYGKYAAYASKGRKMHYAGTYETHEEATAAGRAKAVELHGEFAA